MVTFPGTLLIISHMNIPDLRSSCLEVFELPFSLTKILFSAFPLLSSDKILVIDWVLP